MSKRAKTALASAMAIGLSVVAFTATNLTMPWESKRNVAYWDALGSVWTVCYGETQGVKKGDAYTDQQCLDMLLRRMERDYERPLAVCIPNYSSIPFSVKASFLDLAYNVGVGAVCGSTAARRAAAKNWVGACEAMTWFNRAGGRVVRGLQLRREDGDAHRIGDREICLAGLS
ncbi:glycoside hydrolase [Devosia riboflavina]|uniref:Lysozyme n=1 Tax=Devosia riboflavina TaxID=46914 RepID=A0A087M4E4_9HYPH|nr:lysozyme [Devosia riboflavina]KFL31747.1 glycoside hydrolase [Devosia riboflavina]